MRFVSRMSAVQVELLQREMIEAFHAADEAIQRFADAQGVDRRDLPPEVIRGFYEEHLKGVSGWLDGSDE